MAGKLIYSIDCSYSTDIIRLSHIHLEMKAICGKSLGSQVRDMYNVLDGSSGYTP